MHRSEKLEKEKISKLLVIFAVPSVFSLVLHAFYNVVDRIFIGRGVGELGLAGVALCFPILLIIFGFCLLFSMGGASLISLKLGEKKKEEAELVLGNVITLITSVGLLITIVGTLFCDNLLTLFRVPAETLPYARDYISTIFIGSVLFLYGFSMTFIIRAEGNPIYSTLMIVAGSVLNLILDYVFIFHFLMGTRGAALATIMSEAVVALMGISYILQRKGLVHIRRKNLRLNFSIVKRIAVIGLSGAVMNIVSSFQLSALNACLVKYSGNQAVAAIGIVYAVGSLIMLFTFGMAAGMQPIIGYNYGAKRYERVKKTFYYVCSVTFLISLLFLGAIQLFAGSLSSLFCENNEPLIALSSRAMRIYLSLVPLASISILGARYFQAIGKGWHSTFIGLARQLIIFIPALFILSSVFQLSGILYSGPTADFLAVILTIFMLRREMKQLTLRSNNTKI